MILKNITERHQFILQKIQENGHASIVELSELTEVSEVTIRKDLKLLENKNLLFRTRGGSSIKNPYAIDRPINEKEFINAEEKQKIAKAALELIGDTDSIMIGSGTTVFELARCLQPGRPLTVVTPALKVGLELSNRPNVEVWQLGGFIRRNSSSVAGSHAVKVLDDLICGMLFIGVDGIDPEFGISISNVAEASLNQKMIETAQSVVVLADSSKFDRRGLGRICELDRVCCIVTDNKVSAAAVSRIQQKGIKMIVV